MGRQISLSHPHPAVHATYKWGELQKLRTISTVHLRSCGCIPLQAASLSLADWWASSPTGSSSSSSARARVCFAIPGRGEASPGAFPVRHRPPGRFQLMRVTSPPPEPSLTAPPLAWLAHAGPLTVSHRGDVSELHRPSPPIKGLQNPPWLCFDFPLGLASTHSPSLALRAEPLLPPLLKLRCSRCRRISGDSLSSPVGSVEAPHSREPFA